MNNLEIYTLSKKNKFFNKANSLTQVVWDIVGTPCGDKFSIVINSLVPKVQDITFEHQGCVLSKSVTNALLFAIDNKERTVAIKIVQEFLDMCNGKMHHQFLTDDLLMFKKFIKYSSRKNCLISGAKIIIRALNEER